MPIYEYECPRCEKVHELMQKFSDAPLASCPDCEGPVTKIMSLSSFALKGTGWYTTDYKKSSAPKGASGADAAGSSEKSGEKSGEKSAPTSTSEKSGSEKSGSSSTEKSATPVASTSSNASTTVKSGSSEK